MKNKLSQAPFNPDLILSDELNENFITIKEYYKQRLRENLLNEMDLKGLGRKASTLATSGILAATAGWSTGLAAPHVYRAGEGIIKRKIDDVKNLPDRIQKLPGRIKRAGEGIIQKNIGIANKLMSDGGIERGAAGALVGMGLAGVGGILGRTKRRK